ncbi:MAG: ABC-2 family transporter protein [Planctomycetes bacterium]|nr:ABC-2 family transporter protein [Planctomycetota bacterium]MCB9825905.1 ABC-2 family transporter protein [Planctomycetota bacterium]MCB9829951.1 ABC-2 family transporter protein [Planctomycetota bacterium]MCB9900709.1 ABC-2 family transporter protein [Planctomycetota bacterium]
MRPRLFLAVTAQQVRRSMAYRVDFWISSTAGFVTTFGLAWCVWTAVFASAGSNEIRGWTLDGMLLYMVVVVLLGRVVRGGDIDMTISNEIYQGGLNRYLVFPVSYQPFKYAQAVGTLLPALVQLALFCAIFLLVVGRPADIAITPFGVLGAIAAMAVGHVLYFLLGYPLELVAFWADNVWSLAVTLRFVTTLLGGMMIPLALFPGWAQDVLAFTPFPILYAVPAETLLGRMDPALWARHMVVALVWCVIVQRIGTWVWRRGSLQYSGVGM